MPFGCVITLTAVATKITTIGNADDRQLTNFVNSASTAPVNWSAIKGGQVLPHFKHIVSGASTPPWPITAVI
jgi:hypothetical protein